MQPKRARTFVYIDGFNLYHGLREAEWQRYYWLNVQKMASRLIRAPFRLCRTKYFTARVSGVDPSDSTEQATDREASRRRQHVYLEALETLSHVDILEGQFRRRRRTCTKCKKSYYRPEEKMTDVQIATHFITDAFLDRFDSAILVTGDSDLVPPIRMVREHFRDKPVVVAFPPRRYTAELESVATTTMRIWEKTLAGAQLPDEISKRGGVVLARPATWNQDS